MGDALSVSDSPGTRVAMAADSQVAVFNDSTQKFVSGPDDARGYIALGLFLSHHLSSNRDANYVSICREISSLSHEAIAVLYFAAAKRMLDVSFQASAQAQVDDLVKADKSAMLLERSLGTLVNGLGERLEDKLASLSTDVGELKNSQSPERQVVVSAASSAAIIIMVVLIGWGVDLLGFLKKLLGV